MRTNGESKERIAGIKGTAETLIALSVSMDSKKSRKDVIEDIFKSEPFCNYPEIKKKLLEG